MPIAMAGQVLRTISKDKAERARLMSEYKFVTDHQSKMVQAERRGRAEAEKNFMELLNSGKSIEEIKKQYVSKN
ncbi:MAG: hypothetical protein Ta2G_03630 [Termitinemataceae bacterium]|nr:MAG: hypothetical protein Ta2G_03630 [Termitinemataceae bacterium]